MKTRMLKGMGIALGTGAIIALAGCNGARETTADEAEVAAVVDAVENQQFCPVMDGMPIDKDLYVDYEGQRVYFCCAGCVSAFEAEPEKYMEKLKEIHADPDHEPDPAAHDHDHHDH